MMATIVALFGFASLLGNRGPVTPAVDVRALGTRPAAPQAKARQLTNPRTGTTCTLLLVPAPGDLDPGIVRTRDARLDAGIVGPAPPCVAAKPGERER